MDREDFMDIVYSELESDPDNNRANRIIWAADVYAERRVDDALQVIEELQSAQLGTNLAEAGTDCISRQAAIDALKNDMASLDHIIKGMSAYDVRLDAYVSQRNQVDCDIDTINNLPAAQPKPCEDAVSRKDCLKALSNMMDTDGFRNGWAVSRANVECMLKAMPSVTPKQRTGHWIPVGMVEVVGGESAQWGSAIAYHKCSVCNEQALRDDFEQEVLSDFCPHCGCRMERMSE